MLYLELLIPITILLVPFIISVENKILKRVFLICLIVCMCTLIVVAFKINSHYIKMREILNNNNQSVCINNQYGIVDLDSCYKELPTCINTYDKSVILAYNRDKYTGVYNIISFYPLSNNACNQDDTNTVINRIKSLNQEFTITYNK